MELIEEDLGSKINEFLEIDKEPISAASLGQVHKARLRNKDVVAVKVQARIKRTNHSRSLHC